MGMWLSRVLVVLTLFLCSFTVGVIEHASKVSPVAGESLNRSAASGPVIGEVRTNLSEYVNQYVPLYKRFEVAFDITDTTATNSYFPYDPSTPPGVEPSTGITVDARFLAPGETNWHNARSLPCFYYQPVEQVGSGAGIALLPVGKAEWRCRFTPDVVGDWRYKIQAADDGGSSESQEMFVRCVQSEEKGFVTTSQTDSRFFEFTDGTPFVMPLISLEQGSSFNTLAEIRENVPKMGQNGVRFVRWFPTGEGANSFLAPYGDSMRINWGFGDGWTTSVDPDVSAGKLFSYTPYYYSSQRIPIEPNARYRLTFRAKVEGDQVLRPQLGNLAGGTLDICSPTSAYHEANGGICAYKRGGWHDYVLEVETPSSGSTNLSVALRGLYVSSDAPSPYNNQQAGSIHIHSIQFQREETEGGDWGPNLLTRSDPDTYNFVDQRSAARLDEIFRLSEEYGVYHKLTLFHKNDAILNRFQADGTIGDWFKCAWGRCPKNFYSDDGQASRWYQDAYTRYFVARWSYSPALHSLELANENDIYGNDENDVSFKAGWHVAELVHDLSPRRILMSNSFYGWWVNEFWTDPERGQLIDYADKHWYANYSGSACDATGENCELISNVWSDSAAYVRECRNRFSEYSQGDQYQKPIVRGEGGVAESGTGPQHPLIATDPQGIYYHKKLWAHVGVLGYSCDGEWYPRLFVSYEDGRFPNEQWDLYKMFAAYERFVKGETLSSGVYVEIGTDLAGGAQVVVNNSVGELRAWGVRDDASHKVLLWIDNAQHTWKNTVDGVSIQPASATLAIPGLQAGQLYKVVWWDPYASESAAMIAGSEFVTAQPDGTIDITVSSLARDVALKASEVYTFSNVCYLPLAYSRRE